MNPHDNRQSSLELYRKVTSEISLGVFLFSPSGELVWMNKTMLSILGSENEEVVFGHYQSRIDKLFTSVDFIDEFTSQKKKLNYPYLRRATLRTIKGDHHPVSVSIERIPLQQAAYYAGYISLVPPVSVGKESLKGIGMQLRSFFERIDDFYYIRNLQGEIITGNKTFFNFLTVNTPSLVSKEKIKSAYRKSLGEIFDADEVFLKMVLKKGPQHMLLASSSEFIRDFIVRRVVIPSRDNNESSILISGHEFFDFSSVENSIIDTQTNLNNLIESSESLIWLIDKNFKIVRLNSGFSKFAEAHFAKSIREGVNALDAFPKSYSSMWKKAYQKALKGESSRGEIDILEHERTRFFEYNVKPVFDTTYRIVGVSVFLNDISFRKEAEEFIRESESRFRQLAEYTKDALILSDQERIIYVNPAFKELFDITPDQAYQNKDIILSLLDPGEQKKYAAFKRDLKNDSLPDTGRKFSIVTPKGIKKLVWMRVTRILTSKKELNRELIVITNLSSQYELENAVSRGRVQQKAILDNIPYLAWLKDNEGRYISINEPFASFFDLHSGDIIGKHDDELFDENITHLLSKYDTAVRVARKRKYFEDEWNIKGNPCWIETFASPIFGEGDKLLGITGIARDITDRKAMEDTIIRNEEHFRALLQYSSDTITILDKSGTIMFESALRNRITDFMIDEIIGKSFEEIIHPDDIYIFRDIMKTLKSHPTEQLKREYRCLHKNKRWIYVESIFSNHIHNPSIRGIVVNSRDISDRKMSELKERVYHDNLVFLSNSALELLGLSGKTDIYKYIGKKLYEYLEYAIVAVSSFEEQQTTFKIEAIDSDPEILKALNAIYEDELIGQLYEINDLTKSISNAGNISIFKGSVEDLGLNRHILSKLKKIKKSLNVSKIYYISMSRDNKLLGNILILTLNNTIIKYKHIIETFVHQVSVALQRSQLEYELIKAKEKAEESDKLKTAFLANMSHEIRTPMNGILGFAEMLNDDHLGEGNRKKYVEIINNNGKMLMNLIDDVIDFAKIEAGEIKILKQEFSLNALLTQIHSSFLSETLKKDPEKLKLRVKKALENQESFILCDPNRLRQILMNLVGNAFKFTKEGYIEFGYHAPKDGLIQFYVKDTGIGIAPEKLELIFERFVQADYSRSRKYSGSGLGLAISKGFVELLGGKMWATSTENEGSVFHFNIPYVAGHKKPLEEIEKKKPKTDYNWEGRLFLVAEDDTFSFKLLEGFLKKTNARIMHAEDGQKAVKTCEEHPEIDLILMDVQMPEMNGMEATRIIKDKFKNIPIIAQTANAIAEERQRCFDAGCDDFVTKPINISELFLKIDQWLASR
ncbi:MAG: PAS domain S-box protein [Bacteroidales bacterium]|nr:PAS domain S-box protein [Bacteroidales bacterium]